MSKEEIKLTENEGAIVVREDSTPEIYDPIGVGDHCVNVRFTLAFLLYAVEKDEWVEEFSGFVDSIKDRQSTLGADLRRSQFEIIDGEKD